ncbi:MAG: Type II secretion system protein E [Microgenomates group bacterium GW2011_GWA2_46_7]|nr:MAG: Type II secretion system protein E [Microgenomates group bacterium GW2011_GWA2_46_7]
MIIDNKALYTRLVELKVIDNSLLDDALVESVQTGDSLIEILLSRDLISDENLGVLVADMAGAPFVRLERIAIKREMITRLPESMSLAKLALVFSEDEKEAHVAMADPKDVATIELLKKRFGKQVKIYYATERDIRFALFAYRKEADLSKQGLRYPH